MTDLNLGSNKSSRILVLSLRDFKPHVCRSFTNEFENVICDFETVDVFLPAYCSSYFKKINNKLAKLLENTIGKGDAIKQPMYKDLSVDKEYELFSLFANSPQKLYF